MIPSNFHLLLSYNSSSLRPGSEKGLRVRIKGTNQNKDAGVMDMRPGRGLHEIYLRAVI